MNLEQLSSQFLLFAFIVYCLAFIFFAISVAGARWSNREPDEHRRVWGRFSVIVSLIGLALQLTFVILRWIYSGHVPVSNMFEFMTFLSMMIVFAYVVVYFIYRKLVIGLFAMPLAIIMLAYAAVFPQEVQPLIPALKSKWLYIHVTLAALGEAFFAVGFAAGVMYLLRTVNFKSKAKRDRKQQRGVEFTLYVILVLMCFIGSVFVFQGMGYEAVFTKETVVTDQATGEEVTVTEYSEYALPPLFKPHNSATVSMTPFLGMTEPPLETPGWMQGVQAGRKFNTMVWSLLTGLLAYGLLRLVFRKPLGAVISPVMNGIDPEDLDEITYRSIAIGYPIFTLGALIFAMFWAHEAWGRFWGWDPKETWALITWLFYSAYLHLRLSRGWHGTNSSWLAVLGFIIVMFTLVGINLVVAGLHSYAGVQ